MTLPVGKHHDLPDDVFDHDELQAGIHVEMEHTDDPAIAKEIAKDHLAEIADYYTRLVKMEAAAAAAAVRGEGMHGLTAVGNVFRR